MQEATGAVRYHTRIDLDSDSTHARVVRLVGEDKRVLELGCATGYMSEVLRGRGCRVVGVELDPDAAGYAAEWCERVIVGDLDELDLESGLAGERFDVVVAADVLEHLREPGRVLERLLSLLADDGYVVASIPNVAHGSVRLALLGGRFPYGEKGLLDRTHLRFFTREDVERLFTEAGYRLDQLDRQTKRLDETEVRFDAAGAPPALVEQLAGDREALTYQFIAVARPDPALRAGPVAAATRCSIVIPVHGAASLTQRCLDVLIPLVPDAEVIVVDDASPDDTRAILSAYGDQIRVVSLERNRGFAGACNAGAAVAAGEYLVFLNNDTIPTPGWLDELVAYADAHPRAAVVGAKLLYPDDTIQHAGVVVCADRTPRHVYAGFPADHPAVNVSRTFQIVTAACALFRRGPFERAGGFDTAYVNGHEDVDLCLRLGDAGYEVHYCHRSVVYHLEAASRDRDDAGNYRLYLQRWGGRVRPDELRYYAEDGLLELDHSTGYPLALHVAPELAQGPAEAPAAAEPLAEVLAEAARLVVASRERDEADARAGDEPPTPAPELLPSRGDERRRRYEEMVARIHEVVPTSVPPGASVLVVSKGDDALLALDGLRTAHFPQDPAGQYAGHHPGTGTEAVAHLEQLRAAGAEYIVFPSTGAWWLDHYGELRRHLESHGRLVLQDESCLVYRLERPPALPSREPSPGYGALVASVRGLVEALVPRGAGVAVVSEGDDALLALDGRPAWHVPHDDHGSYAGHHPATGGEALAAVERARAAGADYLLLPATSFWWLERYAELREALERRYRLIARRDRVCALYDLHVDKTDPPVAASGRARSLLARLGRLLRGRGTEGGS